MAVNAQRNKILLEVIPGSATKFLMMDLQVLEAPAGLTSPPVPLQDF
ncbi:MAG TPA: hypothetical protein VFV92_14625 [Candidatus Bathyarchaeia archaeon]|nr:hypothetical protein [Candidatus Bathyarchaeia archaeon]